MKIKKEDEIENKDALINDIKQALTKDDAYYENLKNLTQDELLDLYSKTRILEPKQEKEKDKYDLIDKFYKTVSDLIDILKRYNNTSYLTEILESLDNGNIEIVDNNSNLDLKHLDRASFSDFKNLIKISKEYPYSFIIDSKFFSVSLRDKYYVLMICVFPKVITDLEEIEELSYDLDNICENMKKRNK